ncbi:DUF676-domain-containing protein [Xylaria sp. CBS 124048]|nr:DUF676-domain-containing protein [Xylaria sp. CBS 124048]
MGTNEARNLGPSKGVFSKAVYLKVEDTESLWNSPQLPSFDERDHGRTKTSSGNLACQAEENEKKKSRPPKKVHLVILTHGLHSNLGADMLYLKESIDATARQAKADAKARKAQEKVKNDTDQPEHQTGCPTNKIDDDDSYDEEEVIVRGFSGNATRTERGIKFLGKRLARYILLMTYPDQPFLPLTKKAAANIAGSVKDGASHGDSAGRSVNKHAVTHTRTHSEASERGFRISSISLIGHSLGGLVQTYAIAYIQKHSPRFFDVIRPVNFIAIASPLLGLSNENPLYVKFALDFGLVGRTGQDLGLTWRAPTIARSGWGAVVGALGETAHKKVMGETQPESKPLLRILPTGPAHTALKKFRHRTVYSNVVNDGIVPLRTSCLLFLDWQGLDRVEKARREAGLVETVVGFGWAELTGTGMSSRKSPWNPDATETPTLPAPSSGPESPNGNSHEVPQPSSNATIDDDRQSLNIVIPTQAQELGPDRDTRANNDSPFSGLFNFFKGSDSPKTQIAKAQPSPLSSRETKIFKRGQTLNLDDAASDSTSSSKTKVSSGQELESDAMIGMSTPPRTTFFESAGDLLNPKLPSVEFILDPSKRPRTIFHDRVYHPSDIPPPPLKKRPSGMKIRRGRTRSSNPSSGVEAENESATGETSVSEAAKTDLKERDSGLSTHDYDDRLHTDPDRQADEIIDSSNMKVEEKIARAYHRDLSWRKVLVKLEPDAHNNIIVRRTFANAYGWPVVKHLVDAHFSDSATSRTDDDDDERLRANKRQDEMALRSKNSKGEEDIGSVDGQIHDGGSREPRQADRLATSGIPHERSTSEMREAVDAVPDLPSSAQEGRVQKSHRPPSETVDLATWSDRDFADSGDESDGEMDLAYGGHHLMNLNHALMHGGEGGGGDGGGGGNKWKGSAGSGPAWNWTEKIVGKSASAVKKKGEAMSPNGSRPGSGGSAV